MSATIQVLLALVPYTQQNLLLTYSPNRFFNELEKNSEYSTRTLRQAYRRAQKTKLVDVVDGRPELTRFGRLRVQPFIANTLSGDVQLMVIFDIPEATQWTRRQFRLLLRKLDFYKVQQSVWVSSNDHRQILIDAICELKIEDDVRIFEAAQIFPKV